MITKLNSVTDEDRPPALFKRHFSYWKVETSSKRILEKHTD